MLVSQMTSVSQVTKSSFLLHGPSTAIARSTRLPRKCRHQQVRSFRIGLWSSYLDPAPQKELQRRHRVIKHKYAEAVNRKLSWDRRLPGSATRWALKGLMCSSWRAHGPRPGGRWVNVDELRQVEEDSKPASSRGIEEVEQDAVDELFRLKGPRSVYHNDSISWSWVATDANTKQSLESKYRKEREARRGDVSESRLDGQNFGRAQPPEDEQEYVIDPITNRKVFGRSKLQPETQVRDSEPSTEIPVKTFKGYRSQFSRFEPPVESVESKVIHLDGARSTPSSNQKVEEGVGKYKPFKYNEPDGKPSARGDAGTDKLREHDHLYKPFKYNEPDGKIPEKPDCVSESLSDFDHPYRPFKYNEPDGKFPEKPDCVSESLSDFDHQYKPFKYNEPDGKFPEEPNLVLESSNNNEQPYKPFRYNEPDGKFPEKADPVVRALEDYDHKSRHDYRTPPASRNTNDTESSAVNSHARVNWLSQEGFSSNVDRARGKRTAVQPRREKQSATIEPSLDRSSQPKPVEMDEIAADNREDLDLLRASDVRAASGILKRPTKETQSERDKRRSTLEADFDQIQVRASSLAEDIAAAQKIKKSRQLAQDLELERSYLLNYNAHARGRVNVKIAELDAEIAAGKAHSEAQKKVTGNFVRDFPEEFNTSWGTKESDTNSCLVPKDNTDPWGYDKSPKGLELSYQQEMENGIQRAENDYVAEVTSTNESAKAKLETSLNRSLKMSTSGVLAEHDPYTKEPQGLETSYAEEVKEQGNCESPLFVKSYGCGKKEQERELVRDIRSIYESSYGTIDCNHRQIPETQKVVVDAGEIDSNNQFKATIQRLEREVREGNYEVHERYMDVAKVLAKQAQTETKSSAIARESSAELNEPPPVSASPEPTLYRILAYDPVMQNIKMAETTSIVSDNSSALTPAEVLIRLSNPAKFFPHFQPLQSQGYEIASGSGDVLVFRKVREGNPLTKMQPPGASIASSTPQGRKVVNPIDGMQSAPQPTTGNFASPTGFVNHDLPPDHPFISGIDVRREEPVFSGRRTEWPDDESDKEGARRKSKKVGRGLLVGAAWVAACSYAVGVVAEFFRTGGSDGKGPVGF